MMNALALIGFLGFIVLIVMGIISLFKKNGKTKKQFLLAAGAFILFMVGAINSPTSTEEAATELKSEEKEAKKKEPEIKCSNDELSKIANNEKISCEEAQVKLDEIKKKEAEEKVAAEAQAKKEAEEKAAAEKAAKEKAAQEAAAKKANAKTIPYAQFKKNPDRYKDDYVKYTGQIIQIQEGENFTTIRLAVTKDSYGYNFNDVIYVEYNGLTDYVEKDVVTIYGKVYGNYSYTSQAGWEISLPGVIADEIKK